MPPAENFKHIEKQRLIVAILSGIVYTTTYLRKKRTFEL